DLLDGGKQRYPDAAAARWRRDRDGIEARHAAVGAQQHERIAGDRAGARRDDERARRRGEEAAKAPARDAVRREYALLDPQQVVDIGGGGSADPDTRSVL